VLKDARTSQRLKLVEEERKMIVPSFFSVPEFLLEQFPSICAAFVGSRFALSGRLPAADLAQFSVQVSGVVGSVKKIQREALSLWDMTDRRFQLPLSIMDLLERKPRIGIGGDHSSTDKNSLAPNGSPAAAVDAMVPEVDVSGDIVFDNVSFKYRGGTKLMLKKASLTIKAGTYVGICGAKGAGKTTMFRLLQRLYDPTSGEIRIGGKPLKNYPPLGLRSQIGFAMQGNETTIFSKTLRDNIIYGSEHTLKKLGTQAKIDAHIEAALRAVSIWDHFSDREKFSQGTMCLAFVVYQWCVCYL
jgi:ABC-type multidrug transport system fused ATPase/permease subunit